MVQTIILEQQLEINANELEAAFNELDNRQRHKVEQIAKSSWGRQFKRLLLELVIPGSQLISAMTGFYEGKLAADLKDDDIVDLIFRTPQRKGEPNIIDEPPAETFVLHGGERFEDILDLQLARFLLPELKIKKLQELTDPRIQERVEKYKKDFPLIWQQLNRGYAYMLKKLNPDVSLDPQGRIATSCQIKILSINSYIAQIQLLTISR